MPPWPCIALDSPPEDRGRLDRLRPLPTDVPERFDWGIGVLGRAKYLAEVLDIPLGDAAEVFETVDDAPAQGISKYFQRGETSIVADFLERVLARMNEGVTPGGRAQGTVGEQLTSAEWISVDERTSRLRFVPPGIDLDDFRRHLETLIRMFRFAEKHGLWLWIEREID